MNGAFDRDKARSVIEGYINPTLHLLPETQEAVNGSLDRLAACVTPDRRIAQISALCKAGEAYGYVRIDAIRDVLRGGS